MVDRGYDVYMLSSRGTRLSNRHVKDRTWSLEERWDQTWADMGTYDLPAALKAILSISGKEKATIVGYSQGSSQTFYALSKY